MDMNANNKNIHRYYKGVIPVPEEDANTCLFFPFSSRFAYQNIRIDGNKYFQIIRDIYAVMVSSINLKGSVYMTKDNDPNDPEDMYMPDTVPPAVQALNYSRDVIENKHILFHKRNYTHFGFNPFVMTTFFTTSRRVNPNKILKFRTNVILSMTSTINAIHNFRHNPSFREYVQDLIDKHNLTVAEISSILGLNPFSPRTVNKAPERCVVYDPGCTATDLKKYHDLGFNSGELLGLMHPQSFFATGNHYNSYSFISLEANTQLLSTLHLSPYDKHKYLFPPMPDPYNTYTYPHHAFLTKFTFKHNKTPFLEEVQHLRDALYPFCEEYRVDIEGQVYKFPAGRRRSYRELCEDERIINAVKSGDLTYFEVAHMCGLDLPSMYTLVHLPISYIHSTSKDEKCAKLNERYPGLTLFEIATKSMGDESLHYDKRKARTVVERYNAYQLYLAPMHDLTTALLLSYMNFYKEYIGKITSTAVVSPKTLINMVRYRKPTWNWKPVPNSVKKSEVCSKLDESGTAKMG